MAKSFTSYVCQQCGYISPQYLGRCPECQSWNTFVETAASTQKQPSVNRQAASGAVPVKLADIKKESRQRMSTGINELDLVLGGGLVNGQVVLLAGEPGVGKSTLLLQIARMPVLYVSGEESPEQISIRAHRLGLGSLSSLFLLAETNIEQILSHIENSRSEYRLLIVDSIQTMWSSELTGAPGSVGQVRECAYKLMQAAKRLQLPIVIVGQVTKEGSIAGPKVLEHLVDTVLYMEGSRYEELRLLRVEKNRFGPADEVGVFSMQENGLQEVSDPSGSFYTKRDAPIAGHVAAVVMEGSRPIIAEIQALVAPTELKNPRRVANGINLNRLVMIVGILSKHLRLPFERFDVYINVSGGLRVEDPGSDLAIGLALYSSINNIPLPVGSVAIGELSLLGEILPVSHQTRRIREAKKAGFTAIFSADQSTALHILVSSLKKTTT